MFLAIVSSKLFPQRDSFCAQYKDAVNTFKQVVI